MITVKDTGGQIHWLAAEDIRHISIGRDGFTILHLQGDEYEDAMLVVTNKASDIARERDVELARGGGA